MEGNEAILQLKSLISSSERQGRLAPHTVYRKLCKAAETEHYYQFRFRPTRVIIAAAGSGTRFGTDIKVIAGGKHNKPLLLRVLDSLAPFDDQPIIIINPYTGPRIKEIVARDGKHNPVWVIQEKQRGMGHAILVVEPILQNFYGNVVIAWGDMGALHERLVFVSGAIHQTLNHSFTLPTKWRSYPYVSVTRSQVGHLTKVLQRREGHSMPEKGENDCGVFWVRCPDIFRFIHEANNIERTSNLSNEIGFLSVISYISQSIHPAYATCIASLWESQGVNTIEELARADSAYQKGRLLTLRQLSFCTSLPALLDCVTCSTIDEEIWYFLKQRLAHLGIGLHEFLNCLPFQKQRALQKMLKITIS